MPNTSTQHLSVLYRPINELKLNPKNTRLHSDRQIKQIAHSMKAFGNNVPILIDESGNIIAGHGRLLAATRLGWTQMPTIMLAHLTPQQAKAFSIADNRLTENSTWDDTLLGEVLKELSELNLDFSLEVTGFTMGEIDFRIEGLSVQADKPDSADALPDMTDAVPITKPGDVWLLDRHRLFCGSALESASYQTLMSGKLAAMIFTDPPFNVKIHGHVSGLGAIKHREFAMASGEMTEAEFTSFLTRACSLMARHSIDGSIHYVVMDWRHVGELLEAGKLAYSELKNICVWSKDNAGMGAFYRSQHEFVLVFKRGRASHQNNVQLGQYGRYRTNIWKYPSASTMSRSSEDGNLLAFHPTCKPIALVADAIMDVSSRGDIILDVFLGSGTTLLAAERTGRICHGMELDPLYVDTAIRRWQQQAGGNAVHAETGKCFNEMAAEMEASHV